MKAKFIILAIITTLLTLSVNAQVVVANQKSNQMFDKGTKRTPSLIKIKKGQTKEINFYVFNGNVYSFDFEASSKLGNVNIRIESESGETLFDNALEMYCSSVTLFADSNQKIKIYLTTQPPKMFQGNKKQFEVKFKVSYKKNTYV